MNGHAPEVHVVIDALVLHGLTRSQAGEVIAEIRAGVAAGWRAADVPAEPRTSSRERALGRTVARRIVAAGRP